MIGLRKEIIRRQKDKDKPYLDRDNELSIVNISRIINKSYNATKRKLEVGPFTVEEAIKIYRDIGFRAKSELNALEYLFTEQGD